MIPLCLLFSLPLLYLCVCFVERGFLFFSPPLSHSLSPAPALLGLGGTWTLVVLSSLL